MRCNATQRKYVLVVIEVRINQNQKVSGLASLCSSIACPVNISSGYIGRGNISPVNIRNTTYHSTGHQIKRKYLSL